MLVDEWLGRWFVPSVLVVNVGAWSVVVVEGAQSLGAKSGGRGGVGEGAQSFGVGFSVGFGAWSVAVGEGAQSLRAESGGCFGAWSVVVVEVAYSLRVKVGGGSGAFGEGAQSFIVDICALSGAIVEGAQSCGGGVGVCVWSVVVEVGVGVGREVSDIGEFGIVFDEEWCETVGVSGGSKWGWGGVRGWWTVGRIRAVAAVGRAVGGIGAVAAVGGVFESHRIGVV